jgi:O-antigen ligase
MAHVDRSVTAPAIQPRAAAWQPAALLIFLAAAFLLPTEPAYALLFYAGVLPLTLLALWGAPGRPGAGFVVAAALILWSALTLIWGHDDGHRSWRFALDSLMTLVFLAAMGLALGVPASARRLAGLLIWLGAANAALSIAIGVLLPHNTERLHGWGATSHPILGASVMGVAYLAAITRALTERRLRTANVAAAALMVAFILMTESRGPLLAMGAATLFVILAGRWRWHLLAACAVLAAAWRLLLPAALRQHDAAVLVSRGSSHRFEIWHRTLELIGQRPLFGHGLAANLDLPGITFPHDLYLSVLFYSGAVGFALFLALAAIVTWRLWRQRDFASQLWLWMASLWIAALIAGLTDLGQITKGPGPLWFIFWLPVGLVLAANLPARPGLSPSAAA